MKGFVDRYLSPAAVLPLDVKLYNMGDNMAIKGGLWG